MGAPVSSVGMNQLTGSLLPWSGAQWHSESVPYRKAQEDAQRVARRKAETSAFYGKYSEYDRLYAALLSLSKLEQDWDGYGAPSPSLASVDLGAKYLGAFLKQELLPERVVPSAEGGVALMFDSPPKHAYFEITNENELSVGTYGKGQKLTIADLTDGTSTAAKVKDIINNFFER